MRKLILAALTASAAAQFAVAEIDDVGQTGTIQVSGPRTGTSGDNFFNVEGLTNAVAFRSYGVARWDLSDLKTTLDASYGPGNWAIDAIDLKLTQSNAGFTTDGDVRLYHTTDDVTDFKTAASPLTYPFQNTPGTPDLPVDLANPVLTYTFVEVATGTVDTHNLFTNGDANLQRIAVKNDVLAGSLLTIVFEDITPAVAATYRGQTYSAPPVLNPVQLDVTVHAIVGNTNPVADAGADVELTDADRTLFESHTLDGTGSSDSDGTIVSYVWTEGATTLGTGATLNHSFPIGVHTVTLTVTDNGNPPGVDPRSDTDEVTVTVLSGALAPVADAGQNVTLTDADQNGSEPFTLDGSGSTDDGPIANYEWSEGGTVLSSSASPTFNVTPSVGTHTYRLKVTDGDFELPQSDVDFVTINVRPGNIIAGDDWDGGLTYSTRDIVPVYEYGPTIPPQWALADGFTFFQQGVSSSIPFSLVDDSAFIFLADELGIVNSKKLDTWFGVNDILHDSNPSGVGTVTWTFDIAGETNVAVSVDMGSMSNNELTDTYLWSYSIDGGSPAALFTSSVNMGGSQTYELEGGALITLIDPLLINGVVLTNHFRTFTGSVAGTGNVLTLVFRAEMNSDKPYAFDNVIVTAGGNPCPCVANINTSGSSATQIDISDLSALLSAFGGPIPGPCYDINANGSSAGVVDISDLTALLSLFGTQCP